MTREEFLAAYDLNANAFEEMQKATGFMKHLGDILSTSDGRTVAERQYVSGLNFMFTQIMNKQTSPSGNKSGFDIRDLDFGKFVRDYEDVMSADHLEKNDGTERKPYEGAELEAIESLLKNAKSYKKSLNEVLKDKVKKGVDLGEFRKQSTYDKRSDGFERRAEARNAACTMYNVMKEVIGERTWAQRLNPLNWLRMIEENLYMRNLTNQIKEYIKADHLSYNTNEDLRVAPKPTQARIESFAKDHTQSSDFYDVIDDDNITEIENYKNERTEEINHLKEMAKADKVSITVSEAGPDLDKTIDVQELYQNVPSKDLDNRIGL